MRFETVDGEPVMVTVTSHHSIIVHRADRQDRFATWVLADIWRVPMLGPPLARWLCERWLRFRFHGLY